MLIRSMAGDFDISIGKIETEDGQMVVVGKMGVWDSRIYITPRELIGILAKLMRPSILFYILRLPFLALAKKSDKPLGYGGNEQ